MYLLTHNENVSLEQLVEYRDTRDSRGCTIWFYLALSMSLKDPEKRYLLLKQAIETYNIDINYEDTKKCTLVFYLARSGNYDILKQYIEEFKIDTNKTNKVGNTVWFLLARNCFFDTFQRAIHDFNIDIFYKNLNATSLWTFMLIAQDINNFKSVIRYYNYEKYHEKNNEKNTEFIDSVCLRLYKPLIDIRENINKILKICAEANYELYNTLKDELFTIIDDELEEYPDEIVLCKVAISGNYEAIKRDFLGTIDNLSDYKFNDFMISLFKSEHYSEIKKAIYELKVDVHYKSYSNGKTLWYYVTNEKFMLECINEFKLTRNDIPEHFHYLFKTELEKLIESKDTINNNNVPHKYLCPISRNIMSNPVIISTGQIYDKQAISDWFKNNDTCPITRIRVATKDTFPVVYLKDEIMEYLKSI
jgi:hypothetical protein